jgi:signal transduction histidine kinase
VLEFFSPEPAEPDEALLEVMANVGAQLGRVVERTRAERALSEQNERLRELDRMKDEFVALVSHELRTPLTSIRGYLQLLRSGRAGAVPEGQHRFLEILDRNADRLLRLVSDLLFFTQSAAGKLELEVSQVNLGELLSEAVEAASPLAEQRGIALTLTADDAPFVVADRARLGQLVDNLLSNALKFTPEGGRVEVTAEQSNGNVAVSVSDSGIGIETADQKGVFQRFFRAASATDLAIPGTGLGLAISKAIVEAHGGTIAVESELGAGATFRVELPAAGADPVGSEVMA